MMTRETTDGGRCTRCFRNTLVAVLVLLLTPCVRGQSNAPREVYHFNTLGLADDFNDVHPGSDMLPYTEDDIELPERGNTGGTWSAAHHDLNSDGVMDDGEHIFSIIRRDDDDSYTFSSMSHPEYGVIYESEDWVDYHEARNEGPSRCCLFDLTAEGYDFEHNDRPDWEGESNAYPYNNRQADQHGRGKPKYYFDHINRANPAAAGEAFVYDEVEGFTKLLSFQHNLDDPATPHNERGSCRHAYMRSPNAITRGYLIPVDDLPQLEDGSLPSLFGWEAEGFDLAAYLRDTIEPRLEDPGLSIFHPDFGTTSDLLLPITHLMLFQIESPIEVNIGELCNPADAQAQADYWGFPPEGATYRVSHIMGFNDEVTGILFGPDVVRPWDHESADGEARNLWLLDHFYRDDSTHLGRYEFLPEDRPWAIVDDPGFAVIDHTINRVLEAAGPGAVLVDLPRGLRADELPVEFVADVGTEKGDWVLHMVLLGSDLEVKAHAEISGDGSLLNLGGELTADGEVLGGEGAEGPGGIFGTVLDGNYSRHVLKVESGRISLLQVGFGDYAPSDFSKLNRDEIEELVSLDVEDPSSLAGIRHIAIAANGPGVVSTIALLAAPPALPEVAGSQRPGDCNSDGVTDISDVICLLGHLFLGDPSELPCGNGRQNDPANRRLLDSNGDGLTDISDAIHVLGFLFLGTDKPPVLGRDCVAIEGCGDACVMDAP